jgi:hypothetical protein
MTETTTKLMFWEMSYVEFIRKPNGLYTYRVTSETYSNINPVEPIGHHHQEVVHNATIDTLRSIFQELYHTPYLSHMYIKKRNNGRICVIYRYDFKLEE